MSPRQVDLVVAVLFTAVGITIPAIIALRHFMGLDPLAALPMRATRGLNAVGWVVLVPAALACAWNCFLAFIAPWLHRRKHGNLDEYRSVSGLPVIGSLLIGMAALFMHPSAVLGVVLLLLYAIDGYGLVWVLVALARGQS